MTQRTPPAPAPATAGGRGFLPPKIWAPIVGILGAAIIGLGIMVVMADDDGGGNGITVIRPECVVGQDPNCTFRQKVHWHADVALYIDGEQFDFGQEQFISTEDEELSDAAHIHNPRHSVVHVHLEQTTWDEFFRSIGFELLDPSMNIPAENTRLKLPDGREFVAENGKTFKFYVNGVKADGVAAMDITDLARVLISYGDETDEDVIANQLPNVSDQACIPSYLCQDRLPPEGEPLEPCSKGNDTCQ